MSHDHAKKFIVERLQSDAAFRERVADFVLYRGFVSNSHTLDNVPPEGKNRREGACCSKDQGYCSQIDGNCSHASDQNHECQFAGSPHGYEYWVG